VIIELCKHFLNSTTRITVAASTCLAKLFSRKDIKDQGFMSVFVTWALDEIDKGKEDQMQSFFITGLYEAIHRILKILNREDLMKITNVIYTRLFQQSSACFVNTIGTVRLNRTKIAMGICLVLLKKKECSWMHKRSKRNLLNNFTGNLDYSLVQTNVSLINNRITDSENSKAKEDEGISEDVDLECLETLIGFIFDSLKDKETNVRWAAAQGIGRITSRLDLDLADDIVNEIVDTFLHAGENEWHGGLMALGELARRGLLLPSNLDRVIHILKKGLVFEITQGTYTTGSNVRDAACYVAWAFSRAFEPEIMQSYVIDLSSSLLLCALYDKEASCRRAAAAAFQENVGRQGNFPKGIEIITEADYFSLGVRNNSYLVVSVFVSHYQEYYRYFVEHLSQVKLFHVDIDIRRLSAATLSLLTCLDPDYMLGEVLPGLIKKATSANFYERHGAILGVGEILIGLAGKGDEHNLKDCMKDSIFLKSMTANERKLINPGEYMKKFQAIYEQKKRQEHIDKISPEMKKEVLRMVGDLEEKRLYRGKGGDQLRVVVSRFIFDIALAGLKITKSIHNQFMDTLDENIRNPLENIMKEAESALLLFSQVYHKKVAEESQAYVAKFLKKSLADPLINVRRGYTIAITSLSPPLLEENIDAILEVQVKNSEIHKKKSEDDPDLRNFAVKGLRRLITRVSPKCLTAPRLKAIVDRLIYIMDDYSVDRRGDIGSMVRETGMYAFQDLLSKLSDEQEEGSSGLLAAGEVRTIVGLLLQQLVEKMDKMRLIAGSILQRLVDHKPRCLAGLEEKDELLRLFGSSALRLRVKQDQERLEHKFDVSLVDTSFLDYQDNEAFVYFWDVPQCVFPLLVPLLQNTVYAPFVLRGLCLSLGGITASTSDHSIKALYAFVDSFEGDKAQLAHAILDHFFAILSKYKKIERFLTPVFSTLAFFYKIEDFIRGENFEEKSLRIIGILYDELITTKYASKVHPL
jgi:hypothetical protein